jgi:hypothetical protein
LPAHDGGAPPACAGSATDAGTPIVSPSSACAHVATPHANNAATSALDERRRMNLFSCIGSVLLFDNEWIEPRARPRHHHRDAHAHAAFELCPRERDRSTV